MLLVGFITLACIRKHQLITFGVISYIISWAPGCGIVSHGWEQMGADRYNYFPIAFGLCPVLCSVLQILISDESVPYDDDNQNKNEIKESATRNRFTAASKGRIVGMVCLCGF